MSRQSERPDNETSQEPRSESPRRTSSETAKKHLPPSIPVAHTSESSNITDWMPGDGQDFLDFLDNATPSEGMTLNFDAHPYGMALTLDDDWADQTLLVPHHDLKTDNNPDVLEPLVLVSSHANSEDVSNVLVHQPESKTSPLESPADLIDDELTQRLSSRLGQLKVAENGQLRYYGVTSNLHMMDDGLLSLFQPAVRTTRDHGDAAITQAGLDWHEDYDYEQHLLDLYFAWHDPFLQETERDVFSREKEFYRGGGESSFYSPALENAM